MDPFSHGLIIHCLQFHQPTNNVTCRIRYKVSSVMWQMGPHLPRLHLLLPPHSFNHPFNTDVAGSIYISGMVWNGCATKGVWSLLNEKYLGYIYYVTCMQKSCMDKLHAVHHRDHEVLPTAFTHLLFSECPFLLDKLMNPSMSSVIPLCFFSSGNLPRIEHPFLRTHSPYLLVVLATWLGSYYWMAYLQVEYWKDSRGGMAGILTSPHWCCQPT